MGGADVSEPLPTEAVPLGPLAQDPIPDPLQPLHEAPQVLEAGRYRVVVKPPSQYPPVSQRPVVITSSCMRMRSTVPILFSVRFIRFVAGLRPNPNRPFLVLRQ